MRHVPTALCVCVVAAMFIACGAGSTKPIPKADAKLQADRLRALQNLQRDGVVKDWEPGSRDVVKVPVLTVRSAFMLLDMDAKKKLCEVAFLYLYDLPRDVTGDDVDTLLDLSIVHATTGKEVGTYNPASGLTMH